MSCKSISSTQTFSFQQAHLGSHHIGDLGFLMIHLAAEAQELRRAGVLLRLQQLREAILRGPLEMWGKCRGGMWKRECGRSMATCFHLSYTLIML